MKINREKLVELWDAHCKGQYPREFCGISGSGDSKVATRNIYIRDAQILYNFAEQWDFRDVYVSVYAFKEWHDVSEIRKQSAIVNTLFLDFDHEDLRVAFKNAKKLVQYLLERNVTPRVYFSGAKGFHVFIDFPEVDLFFKKESLRFTAQTLIRKAKVSCVDTQVIELARVSRLPLTINTKSGRRCVPINPKKFVKLDCESVLHFCKYKYSPIEIHESEDFADLVRRHDVLLITQSAFREGVREKSKDEVFSNNKKKNGNWRRRRIEYYAKVLKEKGYLGLDPLIVKIHSKSKHADPNNVGSIEHLARVHLVLLMIEEGFTDEEIHEVFKHAKDYNREKTQYYIDYNRKWLQAKKSLKGGADAGVCEGGRNALRKVQEVA